MARTGRIGFALALAAALFAVAGCGSDGGQIPEQDAEVLLQRLDEVQASVESRDCSAAQTNLSQLAGAVFVLPKEVGAQTKAQLRELVGNLEQLIADKCEGTGTTTEPPPDTGASGLSGTQG